MNNPNPFQGLKMAEPRLCNDDTSSHGRRGDSSGCWEWVGRIRAARGAGTLEKEGAPAVAPGGRVERPSSGGRRELGTCSTALPERQTDASAPSSETGIRAARGLPPQYATPAVSVSSQSGRAQCSRPSAAESHFPPPVRSTGHPAGSAASRPRFPPSVLLLHSGKHLYSIGTVFRRRDTAYRSSAGLNDREICGRDATGGLGKHNIDSTKLHDHRHETEGIMRSHDLRRFPVQRSECGLGHPPFPPPSPPVRRDTAPHARPALGNCSERIPMQRQRGDVLLAKPWSCTCIS
ncbi:hypothetical protein SKAU_G00044890 [Synaphobranchus kaupii]|uniref:Uncharacterized protein n=1 Tax=Synaphobranchus kaupii TaxID=118154 RepID=A0A9Q1G1W4_SYNKA|nr:hypothetical protein SKAU_G00044890 [Synaphobranchus kaupii]